jgi:hypothetical protein
VGYFVYGNVNVFGEEVSLGVGGHISSLVTDPVMYANPLPNVNYMQWSSSQSTDFAVFVSTQ